MSGIFILLYSALFLIIEAARHKQTFAKLITHRFDQQPINCPSTHPYMWSRARYTTGSGWALSSPFYSYGFGDLSRHVQHTNWTFGSQHFITSYPLWIRIRFTIFIMYNEWAVLPVLQTLTTNLITSLMIINMQQYCILTNVFTSKRLTTILITNVLGHLSSKSDKHSVLYLCRFNISFVKAIWRHRHGFGYFSLVFINNQLIIQRNNQ